MNSKLTLAMNAPDTPKFLATSIHILPLTTPWQDGPSTPRPSVQPPAGIPSKQLQAATAAPQGAVARLDHPRHHRPIPLPVPHQAGVISQARCDSESKSPWTPVPHSDSDDARFCSLPPVGCIYVGCTVRRVPRTVNAAASQLRTGLTKKRRKRGCGHGARGQQLLQHQASASSIRRPGGTASVSNCLRG
ncbi:hypothetical protein EVG20_g8420 [Dentipellis fragilis]|uniref:Uncharacterized protein n=1 Tax=Dentipellis fragilis TaxID=205917 RepID=A0A4Y9Y773_9AGAM|nr:hypothetical protein EVG20_g8420 [Dentipellis fragilis]